MPGKTWSRIIGCHMLPQKRIQAGTNSATASNPGYFQGITKCSGLPHAKWIRAGKGAAEASDHTRESTSGVPLGAAGLGLAAGAAGGVPLTAKASPSSTLSTCKDQKAKTKRRRSKEGAQLQAGSSRLQTKHEKGPRGDVAASTRDSSKQALQQLLSTYKKLPRTELRHDAGRRQQGRVRMTIGCRMCNGKRKGRDTKTRSPSSPLQARPRP